MAHDSHAQHAVSTPHKTSAHWNPSTGEVETGGCLKSSPGEPGDSRGRLLLCGFESKPTLQETLSRKMEKKFFPKDLERSKHTSGIFVISVPGVFGGICLRSCNQLIPAVEHSAGHFVVPKCMQGSSLEVYISRGN